MGMRVRNAGLHRDCRAPGELGRTKYPLGGGGVVSTIFRDDDFQNAHGR